MRSRNPIVQNALAANFGLGKKEASFLAELIKSKPWNSPKYKAREKAMLERDLRRAYGDKQVDKWIDMLKKAGVWRG